MTVAVAIVGSDAGVDDRAMIRFGDDANDPITLRDDEESFTFSSHAWIRVREGEVEARGGLLGMKLRVNGQPRLRLNGAPVPTRLAGGFLLFP